MTPPLPDALYQEALISFFFKQRIVHSQLRQVEVQRFRASKMPAEKYLERYFIEQGEPERSAKEKTNKVIQDYRQAQRKIAARKRALQITAWIFLAVILATLSWYLYRYFTRPRKVAVAKTNKLYCITPSGFRLHDQPNDTSVLNSRMKFGDSAINELDTIGNTWIKFSINGQIRYGPIHYLQPYEVYKAIDSLYPNYKHHIQYELINSRVALRTVDVIRHTLGSSIREWQIPCRKRIYTSSLNRKMTVMRIPKSVDSINLPGERSGFERHHTVLLQQRNMQADSQFVYQLLEFQLTPDAEIHLYKKRAFTDPGDSCHIFIKDVNAFDAGFVTDNVFLNNRAGRSIARLVVDHPDMEKNEKKVYWEWFDQ